MPVPLSEASRGYVNKTNSQRDTPSGIRHSFNFDPERSCVPLLLAINTGISSDTLTFGPPHWLSNLAIGPLKEGIMVIRPGFGSDLVALGCLRE